MGSMGGPVRRTKSVCARYFAAMSGSEAMEVGNWYMSAAVQFGAHACAAGLKVNGVLKIWSEPVNGAEVTGSADGGGARTKLSR